jgi:hypothetical protein
VEGVGGVGHPTSRAENSGVDHVPGTVKAFFSRLKHKDNGPWHRISQQGENLGGAEEHRRVEIVATGMHPGFVNRVRQSGLLGEGKCIHISAQENHRTVAPVGLPL